MNIIEIAKLNPSFLAEKTIQQVVALCGDGKLKDDNACSKELRQFLSMETAESLAKHAQFCLDNKFERSGEVLQDCINEMGRRLEYDVKNGRYSGVKNDIGFDGLWFDGQRYLVIEVKTTDAYRINLDTVTNYAKKLQKNTELADAQMTTLIVVGRQDTGDLEAQVRGSRHAWTIRLISVEALAKLVLINGEFKSSFMLEKIRRIFLPFEYTRVDNIVDLVFETQQEAEVQLSVVSESDETEDKQHPHGADVPDDDSKYSHEKTPVDAIRAKRKDIVSAFFKIRGEEYSQVTRTLYKSNNGICKAVCSISKRYKREYQPYWYALHPQWLEEMATAPESFLILGCMDKDSAYAIPYGFLKSNLDKFNTTERENGKHYWHLALNSDDGVIKLNLSKVGTKVNLAEYEFSING